MRSLPQIWIASITIALFAPLVGAQTNLLNVSYDPTRELYKEIDAAFARQWKAQTGQEVHIKQSHGGSAAQARAVIDGLEADVVTLGAGADINALHEHGNLLPENWQSRLPDDSTPYTSTIVFVVRKGNPKQIHDWNDLVKPGVSIVTPNPKTSSGGRWVYLAAYGFALEHHNQDQAAAREFLGELYHNVVALDSGARGSTTSFAKRQIGDVLPAWENEAWLALEEFGKDQFEIIYLSESILAEPPVSIVDRYAEKHGTREAAEAYLKFLYTPEAQEIEARHHYRPRNEVVARQHASDFPPIKLFTLKEIAGDWQRAQKAHFEDGGVFDQIYQPAK